MHGATVKIYVTVLRNTKRCTEGVLFSVIDKFWASHLSETPCRDANSGCVTYTQ